MSLFKLQDQMQALSHRDKIVSTAFHDALRTAKASPNVPTAYERQERTSILALHEGNGDRYDATEYHGPLIEIGPEINQQGGLLGLFDYDLRMGKVWDADSHSFVTFVVDGKEDTLALIKGGNVIAKFDSNGNEIENDGTVETITESDPLPTRLCGSDLVYLFNKRIGTIDIVFDGSNGFQIRTHRDPSNVCSGPSIVQFRPEEYEGLFSDAGIVLVHTKNGTPSNDVIIK